MEQLALSSLADTSLDFKINARIREGWFVKSVSFSHPSVSSVSVKSQEGIALVIFERPKKN